VRRIALAVGLLLALAGCEAESPPQGLEATCTKSCEVHAAQCSKHQCRRGCNLVMDRLAESEGDRVLACIERAKTECDDQAWSRCGTWIGPHADGGPPAPKPPPDVTEVEGD
jgi:hypothetical protein